MMVSFSQEIYRLVTVGLGELSQSQLGGKTPHNPLSETHFFSAWVTKSLKQHRFDRCVKAPLENWQRQARTLGSNAQLKQQFSDIARTYAPVFSDQMWSKNGSSRPLIRASIESVLTLLQDTEWLVTTDVVIERQLNLKTGGASSVVVCAKQTEQVFNEDGQLIMPLSLYARGDTQTLIDLCHRQGVLLYQVTEYKSKVKYHGEYVVFPENNGADLPCIPRA